MIVCIYSSVAVTRFLRFQRDLTISMYVWRGSTNSLRASSPLTIESILLLRTLFRILVVNCQQGSGDVCRARRPTAIAKL